VLTSYLILLNGKEEGIEVDGKFSDWDDVGMVEDTATTENPHIDLIKYRAILDNTHLSLYIETQEPLLQGLGESGDSLQVFFDTDQDEATGYTLPYVGAEFLLEVYGKDNRVLSSHLYVFDVDYRTEERRSPNDWNAWAPMFAVETAVKGNKLETQLWRNDFEIDGNNVNLRIRLTDSAGNVAESSTSNTGLNLVQLMIENQIVTPLQPAVENNVLTVNLVPEGEELVLSSLTFEESSTATSADFNEFSLYTGSEKIAEATMKRNSLSFEVLELSLLEKTTLTLKTSLSDNVVSGHVLSLALIDALCGEAAVNIETEEVRGYLIAPPVDFVVDRLFAEWRNPQEDDDNADIENENVDITHYDAAKLDETFFYLRVDGEILAGVDVPATRAIQIPSKEGGSSGGGGPSGEPQVGTQEETPLPVKTGEDAVYIFLDTMPAQGYENPNLPFAADFMIEIKGQNGKIHSARYLEFHGETPQEWKWQFVTDVEAASGLKEIETSVDAIPLNIYFHVVDWSLSGLEANRIRIGYNDWAGIEIDELGNHHGTRAPPTYATLVTDASTDEFVQMGTDASDYDTNNAIDLRDLEWREDSSYYYFRMISDSTFSEADSYALFIDKDKDGDYDLAYEFGYQEAATSYLY